MEEDTKGKVRQMKNRKGEARIKKNRPHFEVKLHSVESETSTPQTKMYGWITDNPQIKVILFQCSSSYITNYDYKYD